MLVERLRARRKEIEEAILVRVNYLCGDAELAEPGYAEGLRAAVTVALEHGIEALEAERGAPPPVPEALLSQARLAAGNGIDLDKVLRRYFVGYALLGAYVVEESERDCIGRRRSLKRDFGIQTE